MNQHMNGLTYELNNFKFKFRKITHIIFRSFIICGINLANLRCYIMKLLDVLFYFSIVIFNIVNVTGFL